MPPVLNDVHSQLNATEVAQIARPQTLTELQTTIRRARAEGLRISLAGGRHAMGGQQFAAASLHIDMSALDRVLNSDPVRGLLHMEAGADWPKIIAASHSMGAGPGGSWGIRQKQTGVDAVSLGGSISANAHGRGLLMQPLGADIEELTLVNALGESLVCSRTQNVELFSLVIGGYGLFGVIYSATLRLTPRQRVKRVVDTMQLSTYIPSYADFLESTRAADAAPAVKETLAIGEHYVPREQLLTFMQQARDVFRRFGTEVIYGTIRAIMRDTDSFLPWAKEDFACVIFNLRTPHTDSGLQRTADTFRALVDASTGLGGSFFLTYHHYASAAQVEACYPRFPEWLSLKKRYDPHELFSSTWYTHYRDAFAGYASAAG